jgi:hypothetical protein
VWIVLRRPWGSSTLLQIDEVRSPRKCMREAAMDQGRRGARGWPNAADALGAERWADGCSLRELMLQLLD